MYSMELLEYFYEKPPISTTFHGRRYRIKSDKTLILGTNRSGVSSIIIDFLSTLDKQTYLYLNLEDTRVVKEGLKNLDTFIAKHNISHLCIENYKKDFPLPDVKNIILSSNDLTLEIQNFEILLIKPLNFEEFIGFGQRNFNSEHIFSLYANAGRFPKSASLNSFENKFYLQESIKLALNDDISQNLFYLLAKNQSKPYSLFKAYKTLKPSMKLSKDKLYEKAATLEKKGFLTFLPKLNSPKSPKKIFLNNFAYKNAITYEKDFARRFENMVFCELDVYGSEIFYTDDVHFYLPHKNRALLCIPFLPPELIVRRFNKIHPLLSSLHINSLQVITLGNEGEYKKEGIACEILPFWEWALAF